MVYGLMLALLLANPLDPVPFLQVEMEGETVAILDRSDYTVPWEGVPTVDEEHLRMTMERLAEKAYIEPINATIDDTGAIVQDKKGRKLNETDFLTQFYNYYYGSGSGVLKATYQEIYPKVDTALMTQVRKKRIGEYTTYFNAGNKNRSHNIALAARAINNTVVLPGEIFSFNKVVGKRTRAKGYLQAPVIVRGELSEGIGGGICQVSSTLFNAVDKAGLHIVQRYSHSRHVAYVRPGRDATVSWYGPDFVFQNKYAYPILIRAKVYGGTMHVSVHSFPEIEYEPRHVPSVSRATPEEEPAILPGNPKTPDDSTAPE
ncbi:VanW family protein [Brevibacillus sp. GCM10020057]|uniref:VanW family protein n=1 Tax=Brevibacillus sp. GCM10020057 TaxID=3317327 RepID=UPI003632B179